MWDRLLFALRRFGLELGGHLGSWRLSVVLMLLAALYYGFLAIWASSSPPQVVGNIASLSPFWLVYTLLLLNTAVCLWRRLPSLKRSLSRAACLAGTEPDWEVSLDRVGARALLRRLDYRLVRDEPDILLGIRRRWSALGSYLFHGALFLLATGFLLTLAARQEARVWVAEGERFDDRPEQFLSQSPPRMLDVRVPRPVFSVSRITPRFWRDELLFTALEAELEMPDGTTATTRINRPLWLGAATFLRLSGFGYAPRYVLEDRDGRTLDSAFVKLNVFPPGQRDHFRLERYPHRFYVEVLPDLAEEEGQAVTRSLNLVNPGVALWVRRGRIDLGSDVLSRGQSYEFEGLELGFPEIHYWGEFSIVSDPGAPVLFTAYLVALLGLLLKLRGPRTEVEWKPGTDRSGGTLRGWGGRAPGGLLPSGE